MFTTSISSRVREIVLIFVAALLGCGGGEEKKSEQDHAKTIRDQVTKAVTGAKVRVEEKDSEEGPSFDGFGIEDVTAKLDGAWHVKVNRRGPAEAWHIAGNSLTRYDGEKETTGNFSVESPCSISVDETLGGMKGSVSYSVTFVDDKLIVSDHGAGFRNAQGVVACFGSLIFIQADGQCRGWNKRFRRWKPAKDTCRVEDSRFNYTSEHGNPYGLSFAGDILLEAHAVPSQRFKDFDAAKKALK